jgi:hypothetical protein
MGQGIFEGLLGSLGGIGRELPDKRRKSGERGKSTGYWTGAFYWRWTGYGTTARKTSTANGVRKRKKAGGKKQGCE